MEQMDSVMGIPLIKIMQEQLGKPNIAIFNYVKRVNCPFHLIGKVQLFWEGHKNLRNPPYGFDIY